jgi:hypothetical protein
VRLHHCQRRHRSKMCTTLILGRLQGSCSCGTRARLNLSSNPTALIAVMRQEAPVLLYPASPWLGRWVVRACANTYAIAGAVRLRFETAVGRSV